MKPSELRSDSNEESSVANVPNEHGDSDKREAKNSRYDKLRVEQEDSSDDEVSKPANSHVNAESSGDTAGNTTNRSRKDSKNESPPVKKQRQRSTSSSSSSEIQHRPRSSSKENISSDARAHLKAAALRSRSSSASSSNSSSAERSSRYQDSLSQSPSKGRSHSQSRERSHSRSRSSSSSRFVGKSKPRSRSQSESSQSRSEEPISKFCDESPEYMSGPKEAAMKVEDSYYTAPEDVSVSKVDQSFVVSEKKIEEQPEAMETEDGVFENKQGMKTEAAEGGQHKTGLAAEEDTSVKTQNICNKENEVKQEKTVRKRRWGSRRTSSKSSTSINISTESLKTLIPDINTNVLKSESVLDLNIHAASDDLAEDHKPDLTQEDSRDEDDRTDVKIKRTVLQEVAGKENEVDERHVEKDETRVEKLDEDEPEKDAGEAGKSFHSMAMCRLKQRSP
ncbi:hypothetical protein LSAT2_002901 [Lamellibrachia satsuma]|nr:hypothetical protein LSAT2_002901 [Lamellibrachia satsuma]